MREHNGVGPIREDGKDLIEVHVAGVCVRFHENRWQLLAGRRTDSRSLFPGKWECGGGQVRKGEDFTAALRRQFFEEFGIEVTPKYPIETYSIPVPPNGIIPGVRFFCVAKEGPIRLNAREFSEIRWLDLPVPDFDWIPGLKETLDAATEHLLTQKPPAKQRPGFVTEDKAAG